MENPPPTAIQVDDQFHDAERADDALAERGGFACRATLADRLRRLRLDAGPSDAPDGDHSSRCARWAAPFGTRLSARIKGDLSPAKHVLLPCELRVRASTGIVLDARPAARSYEGGGLAAYERNGGARTTRSRGILGRRLPSKPVGSASIRN